MLFQCTAIQFPGLIELQCIANCWFAVHCNVLDCTAPPTLHSTALHWVKFVCKSLDITEKLLSKCNWLSVKQQVFYSTCVLAHSIITTGAPYHIYTGLVHNRAHYHTRAAEAEGQVPRYHTWEAYGGHSSLTLGSFKCRAQRFYASLPVAVRTGSIAAVKVKLKKHVKDTVSLR